MRKVNLHFQADASGTPDLTIREVLRIYQRMKQVFQRPGGIWGVQVFEVNYFPDMESRAAAWTTAGGFDMPNQLREGEPARADRIYLTGAIDRGSPQATVMRIIHELAHFVGPGDDQGAILDNGVGGVWVDAPQVVRLSPAQRLKTAQMYATFALDCAGIRPPGKSTRAEFRPCLRAWGVINLPTMNDLSRRTALTAIAASSYQRILGANDRVGVGFIGYGLIGAQHVFDFKRQKDADMVAMAETYQPRLDQGVAELGGRAKPYRDRRKMLEDKDVQAVVVSTPDHWHALHTMMACASGKDVYVEKPLTLFAREGRWMTQVARKHKRVVQTGTQQRSGLHYQKAREIIRNGHLGKVMSVRMSSFRNIMPGFGTPPTAPPPTSITTCGSAPPPSGPSTPSAASIISAGSGTTPAAR